MVEQKPTSCSELRIWPPSHTPNNNLCIDIFLFFYLCFGVPLKSLLLLLFRSYTTFLPTYLLSYYLFCVTYYYFCFLSQAILHLWITLWPWMETFRIFDNLPIRAVEADSIICEVLDWIKRFVIRIRIRNPARKLLKRQSRCIRLCGYGLRQKQGR